MLTDLIMPGVDGGALLERLPASLPTIVITGLDVQAPPRAAALLHKGELTRNGSAFAIHGRHDAMGGAMPRGARWLRPLARSCWSMTTRPSATCSGPGCGGRVIR